MFPCDTASVRNARGYRPNDLRRPRASGRATRRHEREVAIEVCYDHGRDRHGNRRAAPRASELSVLKLGFASSRAILSRSRATSGALLFLEPHPSPRRGGRRIEEEFQPPSRVALLLAVR